MLCGKMLLTTTRSSSLLLRPLSSKRSTSASSLPFLPSMCLFCDQGQEQEQEQQKKRKEDEINSFVTELEKTIGISNNTANTLRTKAIDRHLLLMFNKRELAALGVNDIVDVIRLNAWSISVKEAEKKASREKIEKEKLASWKTIEVYDPERNALIGRTFPSDADFKYFLLGKRATGLVGFENNDLAKNITLFEDLVSGAVYALDNFAGSDVQTLRDEIAKLVRSRK